MNQKTLLGINAVLIIAVIVLYIRVFTSETQPIVNPDSTQDTSITKILTPTHAFIPDSTRLSIAFVYSDSLDANYDFIENMNNKLQAKLKSNDSKFQSKLSAFQTKYQAFQENQPSLTKNEINSQGAELQQMDSDLQSLQEKLKNDYLDLQEQLQRELFTRVEDYLNIYGDEHHYDYVLAVSSISGVLYANEGYNVTQDVLVGLNEAYNKEKSH